VDHCVVVVGDLMMQALRDVREITVFMHGALEPCTAVDDLKLRPPQAARLMGSSSTVPQGERAKHGEPAA
jgi:hypothetical protein